MSTTAARIRESQIPTNAPSLTALLLLASAVLLGMGTAPATWGQTAGPATPSAPADLTPVGSPVILETGPHHRVVQQGWRFINFKGEEELTTNSFVELASGLGRLDAATGQYVAAKAEFETTASGHVIARQTAHQVILAPDPTEPGAVDVLAPDGVRLQSTVYGLALVDSASGREVLLTELQSSQAELISPTTVIYPNAFDGVKADLVYVLALDRLEQAVLLREQIPTEFLEAAGMALATTRVVVLSEFFDPPDPVKETQNLTLVRGQTVTDEQLSFGATMFVRGQAFAVEGVTDLAPPRLGGVRVAKAWENLDGRQFLTESCAYSALAPLLAKLPLPAQAQVESSKSRLRRTAAVRRSQDPNQRTAWLRNLPARNPRPSIREARAEGPIFRNGKIVVPTSRLASAQPALTPGSPQGASTLAASPSSALPAPRSALVAAPAVALDWTQIYGSRTNFTFQGDTTYWVSGTLNLRETTRIEGGAVVKFTNTYAQINLWGPIVCQTGPYRPAVFTAMDDHTVGERIRTNGLSGYYGSGLMVYCGGQVLSNVVFRFANTALSFENYTNGTSLTVAHAQFVGCQYPLHAEENVTVQVRNALFHQAQYAVSGYYVTLRGQHLTVHQCDRLLYCPGTDEIICLTNSLLVGLTNGLGTYPELHTNAVVLNPPEGDATFEAVGAGWHYLPDESPYRRAEICAQADAALQAELARKTTRAPQVLTGPLTLNATLRPRGWWDTYPWDLGYHYDPIDYALGTLIVTNATLTLTGNVAVATFGDHGIRMENGGHLVAEGQPRYPVRLFNFNVVQEQATNWGTATVERMVVIGPAHANDPASTNQPTVSLRFVSGSALGGAGYHVYTENDWWLLRGLSLQDCQFYGGKLRLYGVPETVIGLTNNLFESVALTNVSWPRLTAFNNLFHRGSQCFQRWSAAGPWVFRDNAFHDTSLSDWYGGITNDHNAYIGTNQGRLSGSGTGDVILTNGFPYVSGPLGDYYHGATNLVDAGSRNATNAGLFHYTTWTNVISVSNNFDHYIHTIEIKETNSPVDIGFHSVAYDLLDLRVLNTDEDGLPDYAEDRNGNGLGGNQDPPETDWQNPYSDGDGVKDGVEVQWGTDPCKSDTDGDGIADGDEQQWYGTNPLDGASTIAIRLGYWRFDTNNASKSTLTNEAGVQPLVVTNVVMTNSYDGFGPSFDQAGAQLSYPCSEVINGVTNRYIDLVHGAIRFSYLPFWYNGSSTAAPPSACTLLQVGAWRLSVSATGRFLIFESPTAAGGTNENFRFPLPRQGETPFSGWTNWEIVLTYDRGKSQASVNGTVLEDGYFDWTGWGVEANPPTNVLAQGFYVGSSADGTNPAHGLIDNLETFNAPVELASYSYSAGLQNPFMFLWDAEVCRSSTLAASAVPGGGGIQLQWIRGFEGDPVLCSNNYSIQRRVWGETNWTNTIATGLTTNRYTDTTASSGTVYEYRIHRLNGACPTTAAALAAAPQHRRGKALLLVESGLYTNVVNIVPQIQDFVTDLRLDGWQVLTNSNLMPRHLDFDTNQGYTTTGYSNDLCVVSNRIRQETNLDVLLLLGHISIPYSGCTYFGTLPEDGHVTPGDDHRGAWPADLWYGHLDGVWSDTNVNWDVDQPLKNVPHDCKWDQSVFPTNSSGVKKLELPVGRIDFANMPDFGTASYLTGVTNMASLERALITNYFNKARWYRSKLLAPTDTWRAWIQGDGSQDMVPNARNIQTHLLGTLGEECRFTNDVFVAATNYAGKRYLWGVHGAHGQPDRIAIIDNSNEHWRLSSDLAKTNWEPQVSFYLLRGSWFVDWNLLDDNFLRACLSTATNGLAGVWAGDGCAGPWKMDRVALGYHLGAMLQDTITANDPQSSRAVFLLGDPTLRTYITAPPTSLWGYSTNISSTYQVLLRWTDSAEEDGYYVYRGTTVEDASTNWIAELPQNSVAYTNSPVTAGQTNTYLVRAVRLLSTGAGSFRDLSRAATTNIYVAP